MAKPTLFMILTPEAAGNCVLDPRDPTGGARGGGSKAGFMGLVRAMGRLGKYDVKAFSTFRDRKTTVDCVDYIRITETGQYAAPDVAFAYYDVRPLMGNGARLRIASHHTLLPFHAWPWGDVHTAPCDWATEYLQRTHYPHGEWRTLPNAIEGLDGVEWKPEPGRVLYHTSPDRGLHLLLSAWPEIRRRVPNAVLHVVGEPHETITMGDHAALAGGYFWQRAQELKYGLEVAAKAGGFKLLGRMPRKTLLSELSQAACVALPFELSSPCETFSITVLESLAIGIPVVLSPADALESIYNGSGVCLVQSPARDYMGSFVQAVAKMITDSSAAQRASERGREFAKAYTFDAAAHVLDGIIEDGLARSRRLAPKPEAA